MRRRYRGDAMAFWLHLVPKLNRRADDDDFAPVLHALDDNSTTNSAAVHDDVTATSCASMKTAPSTTKPPVGFHPPEDRSVRISSGFDGLETSEDGLPVETAASVSKTKLGSRLLLVTLCVGGTLLLINSFVFIAMLYQRSRRFNQLVTSKPAKQTTYVIKNIFQGRREPQQGPGGNILGAPLGRTFLSDGGSPQTSRSPECPLSRRA